jgi:hypothetical protein
MIHKQQANEMPILICFLPSLTSCHFEVIVLIRQGGDRIRKYSTHINDTVTLPDRVAKE